MYIVVGLGNPGEEYENTRHNAGKLAVQYLEKREIEGVEFAYTNSFMNLSGPAVAKALADRQPEKLVVIYDDLDLPLGKMKISHNRSSGGHKGVESIIKALKSEEFIRIRIGISPTTLFGKLKKPRGEEAVNKFVLGKFRNSEIAKLEKIFDEIEKALKVLVKDGLQKMMTEFNK